MSKPIWQNHVRNIVAAYPYLKKQMQTLHAEPENIIPQLSGMPGGSGVSRKGERAVLRSVPTETDIKNYNAVSNAIKTTELYDNAKERIQIIDLLIWKNTHTMEGARRATGYSIDTVKDFHAAFLALVAIYRDFVKPWELSGKFYKNYPGLLDKCPDIKAQCKEHFETDDLANYPAFAKKYPYFGKEYVKTQ